MDTQKTKEYLKQIFDIEMALYTHKKVISDYKKKRQQQAPPTPELELPEKPKAPLLNGTVNNGLVPLSSINEATKGGIVCLILLGIAGVFFGGIGFLATMDQLLLGGQVFNNDDAIGLMVAMLLLGVPAGIIGIYFSRKLWKKETQVVIAANENLKKQYENQLGHYQSAEAKARKAYENELREYNAMLPIYEAETQSQVAQLNELLEKLTTTREKLYSVDVVYSKYRDLIAISTIYEYFASGRCSELEGPNGAYNLYENELRANIIIGSLGQIISDLQQIKNGQFALYQELHNSNKVIASLLCNIADNTQMTAYYAKVAAATASADRYIVGMVW